MTVQRRLTVAFVVLAAALVTLLGAFEVVQLRAFLTEAAGVRLRAQAKPTIDGRVAQLGNDLDVAELADLLADDLTSAATGAVVLSSPDRVLAAPEPGTIGAPPPPVDALPDAAVAQAFGGAKEVDVILDRGAERLLVAFVPLPPNQSTSAVVALATPLLEEDTVVRRQLLVWALNVVLAAAVGALIGPLLIRRALRPLRRIAAVTRQMGAGDLSRRARYEGPPDEIGDLARAFDGMADSLERAFARVTTSEAQMRVFVADASHELRTPLTALGGYADVLVRDGADRDGTRRLLVGLRREVTRMHRLVDDLLLLARLDAGEGIGSRPTPLRALAESVAEELRPLAGGRDLRVEGEEVEAIADSDRLRQVLLNLVSNALRHTADDGVIALAVARAAGAARVVVRDDGEGMDAATRARAFTRFARGASPSRGSGSGLGLAIVASIVGAHGGTVTLDSQPGAGTTVTVLLPTAAQHPYPLGDTGR